MVETIGGRIKKLRKNKNITQTDLGKVLGVEKSTISLYENNNSSPNYDILKTIANYFNVTTDYLLGYSKEPEFTTEDEADILKRLKAITEDLDSNTELMFDGEILDDETRELFRGALHTALVLSKKKAKAGLPTWKDYLKG